MKTFYEILGIKRGASKKEVKEAFHKRSKETHPDATGKEDDSEFQDVAKAYAVLADPSRRDRYDRTGEGDVPDERSVLFGLVNNIFMNAVTTCPSIDTEDIIKFCIESTFKIETDFLSQIEESKNQILKFENVMERLKFNGDEINILEQSLVSSIESLEKSIAINEENIEMQKKMRDFFTQYDYEVDIHEALDEFIVTGTSGSRITFTQV